MESSDRLQWVDAAKGLSIILVVMMYSAYNTGEYTGQIGLLHYLIGFATPFRMPEFFLISGLFLSAVIARPWSGFCDRRVAHYLYFYALWATIMIVLKVGIYGLNPIEMARELAWAAIEPYGILWFIYLLAVFGLVAKLLFELSVTAWFVLPVATALQIWAPLSGGTILTQTAAYFVYFYLGSMCAPIIFKLVNDAQNNAATAMVALGFWALINALLVFSPGYDLQPMSMQMGIAALPGLHFSLGVAGTIALCVVAGLLIKLPFVGGLVWLGKHSLVIYVFFTIPMSLVRAVVLKTGMVLDTGLVGVIVMVASIAASVILYKLVQATGVGTFLFERPRWAKLTNTAPSRKITNADDTSCQTIEVTAKSMNLVQDT